MLPLPVAVRLALPGYAFISWNGLFTAPARLGPLLVCISVGLHPTALYAKGGAVFVTDTATNDMSVINTADDKVVQTIATQPWPEAPAGYEPDAVRRRSPTADPASPHPGPPAGNATGQGPSVSR
ncbi:hypothetical protein ACQEV4_27950 [Streptomyces shenzhenensis]|uniref:hypothetical protein n=1 Tax=Streptomyces shenzhenensis TaxID=943815 RepID=UPI003D8C0E22